MKLKMKTIAAVELYGAIRSLDGYERIIKDQSGERVAREVYKFVNPGATRMALALNAAALKPIAEAFEKARQGAVLQTPPAELTGEGPVAMDEKARKDWKREADLTDAMNKLGAKEVTVDLEPIAESDLNIADNPYPASVIATLMPIIQRPKAA